MRQKEELSGNEMNPGSRARMIPQSGPVLRQGYPDPPPSSHEMWLEGNVTFGVGQGQGLGRGPAARGMSVVVPEGGLGSVAQHP